MQNSIVSLVRYLFVVVLLHVEDLRYLGSVLIICLALDTFGLLHVQHGPTHHSPMTTFVFLGTIYQLLLTKRNKFTGFAKMLTFDGTSLVKIECRPNSLHKKNVLLTIGKSQATTHK